MPKKQRAIQEEDEEEGGRPRKITAVINPKAQ
jgi:hypothetical protein